MANVELFSWNPRRPVVRGPIGRLLPIRKHVDNFGDLLGPMIVREILSRRGLSETDGHRSARLLSVGSVLHFARDGDVLWGTGANGKMLDAPREYTRLDVRAVRGPRTRELLLAQGISAPAIYGDPGLLVNQFWPRTTLRDPKRATAVTVVPNLHDYRSLRRRADVLNPRSPLWDCLRRIASSDLVVGSSLHGIVVAESFGIPARLVTARTEPLFKYDDYYKGTGRSTFTVAGSVEEAIEMGGESPPVWSPDALLSAFPFDLWSSEPEASK